MIVGTMSGGLLAGLTAALAPWKVLAAPLCEAVR